LAKAKVTLKTIKIGPLTPIHDALHNILVNAAKVYVVSAYQHVRVDTGMSRGTLRPLGDLLGVHVPIYPERSLRGKSIDKGMAQSKQDDFFTLNGNIHTFEWSAHVKQYTLNELYGLPSNKYSPWKSMTYGSIKVLQMLKTTAPLVTNAIKMTATSYARAY